jgi:hypothetical protein
MGPTVFLVVCPNIPPVELAPHSNLEALEKALKDIRLPRESEQSIRAAANKLYQFAQPATHIVFAAPGAWAMLRHMERLSETGALLSTDSAHADIYQTWWDASCWRSRIQSALCGINAADTLLIIAGSLFATTLLQGVTHEKWTPDRLAVNRHVFRLLLNEESILVLTPE